MIKNLDNSKTGAFDLETPEVMMPAFCAAKPAARTAAA